MTVNASAGAKLFIGGPNSNRNSILTDYQADSYTEVGEIEDLGEFGDEAERIKFTALSDSRTRTFKGPRDAGEMAIVVGDDMLDQGQIAMEAAEGQPLDYNFRVELNDKVTLGGTNSLHYFIGKVFTKRRTVGKANDITRRNFTVGINSKITDVSPT